MADAILRHSQQYVSVTSEGWNGIIKRLVAMAGND